MMKRAKSVDDYIATANQWQDELSVLRALLLAEGLDETIKWGAPCYTLAGKNIVGLMAFKQYFGLWFHQGALLADNNKKLINAQEGKTKALRQWRMQSAKEIKPTIVKRYVKEAIVNAQAGREVKIERNKAVIVPIELKTALQSNRKAQQQFQNMRPGLQREYTTYISEAKREDTRLRRVKKVLPLILAGNGLHDKYR